MERNKEALLIWLSKTENYRRTRLKERSCKRIIREDMLSTLEYTTEVVSNLKCCMKSFLAERATMKRPCLGNQPPLAAPIQGRVIDEEHLPNEETRIFLSVEIGMRRLSRTLAVQR
jgi:hypothetical protein